MNFNELYWNDSILKDIRIDRHNPGLCDSIYLEVDWLDNDEGGIIFEDVYWANMKLNFGIVASESILNGFVAEEADPDLLALYSIWNNLLDGVKLYCYVINLNSSNSSIKIIAKSFRLCSPFRPSI